MKIWGGNCGCDLGVGIGGVVAIAHCGEGGQPLKVRQTVLGEPWARVVATEGHIGSGVEGCAQQALLGWPRVSVLALPSGVGFV